MADLQNKDNQLLVLDQTDLTVIGHAIRQAPLIECYGLPKRQGSSSDSNCLAIYFSISRCADFRSLENCFSAAGARKTCHFTVCTFP